MEAIQQQWRSDLVSDLLSDRTFQMLDQDPYWPKWESPWWKLCLLDELGGIKLLPEKWFSHFLEKLDSHYLHTFPVVEAELPAGLDPYREIICFFALGTVFRISVKRGIDSFERLPWIYGWLNRY